MRVRFLDVSFVLYMFVIHVGKGILVQAGTSSLSPACNVTSEASIGDGSCDQDNNYEDCEYDGGDCCPCTCVDAFYQCGTNGYDCNDPMGPDACATSSPTPSPLSTSAGLNESVYPNCSSVIGYIPYIGDGFCDGQNNNEECGYDGGDCCLCRCVDDAYSCGIYGYDCRDPTVPDWCADATSSYPNCSNAGGYTWDISDGRCHSYNNNEECGYDGGDCCNCTCVDSYGSCGTFGYDCQDPTVPAECLNFTVPMPYPNCTDTGGYLEYINDAYCDLYNNHEECGYDGGDCCACTCVDSLWTCGLYGYDCQDPAVPTWCVNATSLYLNCTDAGGLDYNIDDGYCDSYNNNEECAYDGGDCCACTCANSQWSCGTTGYDCQDPTVPVECVNATSQYPLCSDAGGLDSDINDGYCHSYNNNEECEYDGGDCCSCTCVTSEWSCGIVGYDCEDPSVPAECLNATSPSTWASSYNGYYGYYTYGIGYPDCISVGGYIAYIGDGGCDGDNNNEECGYDGGDCCPCTCRGSYCGYYATECLDPTVPAACANASGTTVGDDDYPSCAGTISYIGDGYCDSSNNNEDCDYDGGDCCPCTCIDDAYSCGYVEYDCQDPTVSTDCSDVGYPTPIYDDSSEAYPDCEDVGGDVSAIGSGYCLDLNNNEECGYDGGDCCPCTCVDGTSVCGSGGYDCQDPTAPSDCPGQIPPSSYADYSDTYPECEAYGGYQPLINNGYCNDPNNIEECGYDGGDCCECTCSHGLSSCGGGGYDCQDPSIPPDCFNDDQSMISSPRVIECMGNASYIGNGVCDIENNNAYCNYDGGDCCSCTCFNPDGSACGDVWFDCHDPGSNCSETLGTVGVAIITSFSVFALTLACYAAFRFAVVKNLRLKLNNPGPRLRSVRPAHHEAVSGGSRSHSTERKTYSVRSSDPGLSGSRVGVTREGEKKEQSEAKPSAPPWPPTVGSHTIEVVEVKEKTSGPKSMADPSPPSPETFVAEDDGVEKKTWDLEGSAPHKLGDAGTVKATVWEETKDDVKSTTDALPVLPDSCGVGDEEDEEEKEALETKPSASPLPDDCSTGEGEEKEELKTLY